MKLDINSVAHFNRLLVDLDACQPAKDDNVGRSLAQAWKQSVSGERLLWLACSLGVSDELLRLAACDCARTALRFLPDGELRPLHAIETAERYARGEATEEELRKARKDAVKAATVGGGKGARVAAWVAQAAAWAVDEAAKATVWAIQAAVRAIQAAAAHAAAEAEEADKKMARLVRARIPFEALVLPEMYDVEQG